MALQANKSETSEKSATCPKSLMWDIICSCSTSFTMSSFNGRRLPLILHVTCTVRLKNAWHQLGSYLIKKDVKTTTSLTASHRISNQVSMSCHGTQRLLKSLVLQCMGNPDAFLENKLMLCWRRHCKWYFWPCHLMSLYRSWASFQQLEHVVCRARFWFRIQSKAWLCDGHEHLGTTHTISICDSMYLKMLSRGWSWMNCSASGRDSTTGLSNAIRASLSPIVIESKYLSSLLFSSLGFSGTSLTALRTRSHVIRWCGKRPFSSDMNMGECCYERDNFALKVSTELLGQISLSAWEDAPSSVTVLRFSKPCMSLKHVSKVRQLLTRISDLKMADNLKPKVALIQADVKDQGWLEQKLLQHGWTVKCQVRNLITTSASNELNY